MPIIPSLKDRNLQRFSLTQPGQLLSNDCCHAAHCLLLYIELVSQLDGRIRAPELAVDESVVVAPLPFRDGVQGVPASAKRREELADNGDGTRHRTSTQAIQV